MNRRKLTRWPNSFAASGTIHRFEVDERIHLAAREKRAKMPGMPGPGPAFLLGNIIGSFLVCRGWL